MANLSAEALLAAETALSRKITEFQSIFGEAWERVFRLAAEMEGDTAAQDDFAGEVAVHNRAVAAMLLNGEPGYWNSSYSNEGEVDEVIATNPCGEIALEPAENCNLGHINLDYFAQSASGARIDRKGLHRAHELMTRFLIRATEGDVTDAEQAAKLAQNRRIGVGHLGCGASSRSRASPTPRRRIRTRSATY
ncbi:hypothetical protein ACFYPZ_40935 [Streptomyces sp. NPDC005506]|uniref:hypothetical protein n=1 Tax=unclassified Streptomyces TaxID=2593676 RepID=UPI003682C338